MRSVLASLGVLLLCLSLQAAAPPVMEKKKPALDSFIGRCGKGECEGIKTKSEVVKKGAGYLYTYTITNCGKKKTWMVRWTIANRATGLGDESHFFLLKPGKSTKITVEHEDPPVEIFGNIRCYDKNKHRGYKEWYEHNKIKITGGQPNLYSQMGGGSSGWIPKSLNKEN